MSLKSNLEWHLLCLCRQRFSKTSAFVDLIRSIDDGHVTPAAQQSLLNCLFEQFHLSSPHQTPPPLLPPPPHFLQRLLRAVILAAEADDQPVIEPLMDAFSTALTTTIHQEEAGWSYNTYTYSSSSSSPPPPPPPSHRNQQLSNNHQQYNNNKNYSYNHNHFTLHLSSNLLEGSTGCFPWEAGFRLSELFLSLPHLVRNKRCLELGCGSGMATISALRAGAAHIWCTDGDQQTLDNFQHNMDLNNVSKQLYGVFQLKWGDIDDWADVLNMNMDRNRCRIPLPDSSYDSNDTIYEPPEVIYGADLLYDPSVIPGLISVLKALLIGNGNERDQCTTTTTKRKGLLVTALRNESTMQQFIDAAQSDTTTSHKLHVQPVTEEELLKEAHPGQDKDENNQVVRFDYIPSLEQGRQRLVIHSVTGL